MALFRGRGAHEAGSQGTVVPKCVHSLPRGLPRQRWLQLPVSLCLIQSTPAFEKYLSDSATYVQVMQKKRKEGRKGGVRRRRRKR